MRIIVGFFRFWYDFIIGDSWEIALGVVLSLLAGIFLVRAEALPEGYLCLFLAAALVTVLIVAALAELRRKLAKGPV
jgi:hypothetical protein